MSLDWFDPSDDVVIRAADQWERTCRRRFGTDPLPVAPWLLFANNGKGELFNVVSALLDAVAAPEHDVRAAGYIHYRLPGGTSLTLFQAREPAPYAAASLDVLMSVGARHVIFVNGAGSLRPDVPVGSVVLPGALVREEGTSYHYAPPDMVLHTSDHLVERLAAAAWRLSVPVVRGGHWTTDGIHRETVGKVARLAAAEVISVDMELSALAAVAQFHRGELAAAHVITDVVAKPHTWTGTETDDFLAGAQAVARLAVDMLLHVSGG